MSLNVFNIGLQCNLQFLSTTVLQGSVVTWVNDGGIFNDCFIAKFTAECDGKRILKIHSIRIFKVIAKNKVAPFFPDTVY